jgi:hypothetical protein
VKNEILEEIWRSRKEIEREHGDDLRKVFKAMKRKTAASKRKSSPASASPRKRNVAFA